MLVYFCWFPLLSSYRFKGFVNNTGSLEVVVGKEVYLIEEVAYIDAAEWIHLGEGEHAREANTIVSWPKNGE